MTDYESESDGQLQIRRLRERASNVSLTPQNVQRVYGSIRTPARPRMNTPQLDSDDLRALDDFDTDAFLRNIPGFVPVTATSPIGTGTVPTTTAQSSTTGVGVGTLSQPSTLATATTTSVGTGTVSVGKQPRTATGKQPRATTSVGKQPRASPGASAHLAARRRRRAREAAELRRERRRRTSTAAAATTTTAAGAGGDGGGGDSSDGGRGSRGGRRLGNDLDRLLNQLRRRTEGRHIAGITHTDTITTTYKDGRPPTVHRSSTRASGTSS